MNVNPHTNFNIASPHCLQSFAVSWNAIIWILQFLIVFFLKFLMLLRGWPPVHYPLSIIVRFSRTKLSTLLIVTRKLFNNWTLLLFYTESIPFLNQKIWCFARFLCKIITYYIIYTLVYCFFVIILIFVVLKLLICVHLVELIFWIAFVIVFIRILETKHVELFVCLPITQLCLLLFFLKKFCDSWFKH